MRAFHPDPRAFDPNRLVCPVYDTLSEAELARYSTSPYNAARFVPRPHALPLDAFLASATHCLADAIRAGAYVRDDRAAFYVYGIQYAPPPDVLETLAADQRREQYLLLGLVGALGITENDSGQIAPHERTFADRVDERVALTEVTKMNFAPIMAGYHRSGHRLNDRLEHELGIDRRRLSFAGPVAPIVEATLGGSTHRLWRLDDPSFVEEIAREVGPYRLLILDGHHRFASAVARRGAGRASFPLTMLVDGQDRALQLLPWHRVLPERFARFETLLAEARREFPTVVEGSRPPSIESVLDQLRRMHEHRHRGFLMVNRAHLWEVRGAPGDDGGADFDLLHTFLETRLGIGPHSLRFVRSPREAFDQLTHTDGTSEGPTAFLLPALRARAVEERAFARRVVMAQKSTMFLPKVAEGMLFAPADEPD